MCVIDFVSRVDWSALCFVSHFLYEGIVLSSSPSHAVQNVFKVGLKLRGVH